MSDLSTLDRFYDALRSGDDTALQAVVGKDVVVDYPAPAGLLPWSGVWEGYEAFQCFFETVNSHLSIDNVEQVARHIADQTTVVEIRGTWTVRASGNIVSARAVNIFTERDGKIVRYQVFNDTAAFALAMGGVSHRNNA